MTATVVCLVALLALSWLFQLYSQGQWAGERARLINAALSRDPVEFATLERERTRAPRPARAVDDDEYALEPIGMSG